MRRRPGSNGAASARVSRGSSHGAAPASSIAEVSDIQRSRLLVGAVGAIEEHGYAATTVASITRRAKVSRRTFYELFEDREACLVALIEDVLALLDDELAHAGLEGLAWRERVRGGLLAILGFFDREPALARVCVVQALRGGPRVLELREAVLARLAGVLDEGRQSGQRAGDCTPLTAEGLVGAAFGIVHARLLRREQSPLVDLAGELMGMIVLPYQGPAAARREQTRPTPECASPAQERPRARTVLSQDPLQDLQMRLTYRTARVLQGISQQSCASNRAVADHAGIQDQGQVSKLLARLERRGLIVNRPDGHVKGEPNAWSLTPLGDQVAQRLRMAPLPPRRQRDSGGPESPSRRVSRLA
jgi:AcrR family transcriptional regulator/DNA-binding MarR family transcriptional regulator